MRSLVIVAVGAALVGCKGKDQDQETKAITTDGGVAAPAPDQQATPTAEVPAVVTSSYYRAPGATAAIRFPDLDEDYWTVSPDREAQMPRIDFRYRHGDATALIQVAFPPRSPTPLQAEEMARTAAAMVAEAMDGTIAGGKALSPSQYIVSVKSNAAGHEVGMAVMATVDGGDLVLITATGTPANVGAKEFNQGLAAVIDSVEVGQSQPRPPPHDPGKPLGGAYFAIGSTYGAYEALVFDPRGYVHDGDGLLADLDAVWAIRDGKVRPYTFDGKTVTITYAQRKETGTLDNGVLVLDGTRYCSGEVPQQLEGHWQAAITPYVSTNAYETFSVNQSKDLYLTKDGTYGYTSFVSVDLTNTRTYGDPIKPQGVDMLGNPTETAEVHSQGQGGDQGRYTIAGNRFTFLGNDGSVVPETIYTSWCPGIDPEEDKGYALYLGGLLYLRQKT